MGCKKQDFKNINHFQTTKVSEKVRDWIVKQPGFSTTHHVVLNDKVISIPIKIRFEETKYFADAKANITPVAVSSTGGKWATYKYLLTEIDDNGIVTSGNYYVVLKKNGIDQSLSTVEITPDLLRLKKIPNNFNGAIIKYDLNDNVILSSHYDAGERTNKTDKIGIRKRNAEPAEQNVAPLDEGCMYITIEWYWQVWVNGLLVYEEYLYASNVIWCPPGGTGGSGNSNPIASCNQQFNNLINSASPASVYLGKTLVYETTEEKSHVYRWKCLTALGAWYVVSYETGTQERVVLHEGWKWKSIVHNTIEVIGMPIGGVVEKTGPGIGTVTLLGNINAHFSLDFTLRYTANCNIPLFPIPPYTMSYTSSTIFSINAYPGGPI